MKFVLITTLILIRVLSFTQKSLELKEKKNSNSLCKCCIDKTKPRIWECGLSDTIIDCNEKLEYYKNTNTVLHTDTREPFTGYCETCHFNGVRERLIYFYNGKERGNDTTYYKSGCPKVIRSMLDGLLHGESIYFYDSTYQIVWKQNFSFGKKHGQQIYFDENHKTKKIEHYYNGVLNGNKKTFFSGTLRLKLNANYKMNVLDGKYESYIQNDTGTVKVISFNYKEGLKEGLQESFYDNGRVMTTEEYKQGNKNGFSTTFFSNGSVMKSENWLKGLRHGEFKTMYPDGKIKWQAEYKKGKLLEQLFYDEFGNIIEPEATENPFKEDESNINDENKNLKLKKTKKKKSKHKKNNNKKK